MKLRLAKFGLLLLLLSITSMVRGETTKIKIYFDKNWIVCKPEKSAYYRIGEWDTISNTYSGDFSDYMINNVKISQGTYHQGKKNGNFNYYYETGSLKITAIYKDDQPASQWCWYFSNNQIHFKISFGSEDFKFDALNDSNGISVLNSTTEFIFAFQNDTSNTEMEVRGTLKNGEKDGKWSIVSGGKILASDIYRGDRYLRSTSVIASPILLPNGKFIKNLLFVPYSTYACDELALNRDISELDYPFLNYLFPWKSIDIAVGLIGDSIITQMDKNPMYFDGMEGINRTIAQNTVLTEELLTSNGNWGYVYYEIIINENGDIEDKKVIKSPNPLMNNIVLDVLTKLNRFRPAYLNGHAIKSKISSRIQFAKPRVLN
jgi:hypothetical protein